MPDFRESLPRPNPFKCCAAKHLWRHGLALAIYDKIGEITNGGERRYHTDTARMAVLFGASKAYVRRMFAALNRAGFLVVLKPADLDYRDGGKLLYKKERAIKLRKYIRHDDWAKTHPGKCVVVDEQLMPWSANADPLWGQIYSAVDGKLRANEGLVKAARNSGVSDDVFIGNLYQSQRCVFRYG